MSHNATSFSKDDLILAGQGALFTENSPKLPRDNMLMIDRITQLDNCTGNYNKGIIHAEFDIDPSLWFFNCHFKDDPVMPGCLGLDALWQLLGFYLGWSGGEGKGRALGVGEVKFTGQILPTAKRVSYTLHIKRILKQRLFMGLADGIVCVDGKPIYHANSLKVGLFSDTSSF